MDKCLLREKTVLHISTIDHRTIQPPQNVKQPPHKGVLRDGTWLYTTTTILPNSWHQARAHIRKTKQL
jgi:hypothetical protein